MLWKAMANYHSKPKAFKIAFFSATKCPSFMNLGPQMAKIRVDNRKGVNFLHWTIWGPPLKIKIPKIGFRHVLSWPKLGLESKFHESGTFGGFGKRAQSFFQYPADF